jgi:hypothetical protein
MQTVQSAAVYRICAGDRETWDVFQDSNVQPLASFEDKNSALTYAMLLARGKVSWQTLLEGSVETPRKNAIIKHIGHV